MNLEDRLKKFETVDEEMSIEEYLEKCKEDKSYYASPADRLLKAIGEPTIIDTAKDTRMSKIFGNRVIRTYETFKDFFGIEEVIEKIVAYLIHNAQGLEESKQVLYLLGPVGSAKSSLAERLKELMEQEPFYALAFETDRDLEISPINESPLGLFEVEDSEELQIPERYLRFPVSPWATKRLLNKDKIRVVKRIPSRLRQIAISKTEPGDENTQDISSLVGKIDIRKLQHFSQDDPDAYRYTGGLGLGNRGILEFVEMFKAPIKMLHPLLTATQEGNYKATEALAAIPFEGIILAHSNESEWSTFKNNRNNEAFLDRICLVKAPYCLRYSQEEQIYDKMIKSSSLRDEPCAPHTLELLSKFCILSRLEEPENSKLDVKLLVYNGDLVRDQYPDAKSLQEYKSLASLAEGFSGVSTRTAFKLLSNVYNHDPLEIGADPVHLFYHLNNYLEKEDMSEEFREKLYSFKDELLIPDYYKLVGKDIRESYMGYYYEYGQNIFDTYITYSDQWIQDQDYRDPDTGIILDRKALNEELEKIEKPAGIGNPKDFRHEVVNFCLRYRASHGGENPKWTSYTNLKTVIEANLFKSTDELLPQLSFQVSKDKEEAKKNKDFLNRMSERGYTERQTRRVVDWYKKMTASK